MAKKQSARRPKGTGSLGKRGGIYRPHVTRANERVYLGTFYSSTEAEEALNKAAATNNVRAVTAASRRQRTFEFVMRAALSDDRVSAGIVSPEKQERDLWILDKYLSGIASTPIVALTSERITNEFTALRGRKNERTGQPLGVATVRSVRAAVKSAFAYAYAQNWIDVDASERATYMGKRETHLDESTDEEGRFRKLTAAESASLQGAIANSRYRARWMLAFRYGLRPGEALGLLDSDWDSATRRLSIRRTLVEKKGGRGLEVSPLKTAQSKRSILIDRHTAELLDEWRKKRNAEIGRRPRAQVGGRNLSFLFTQSPGVEVSPLTPSVDQGEWQRICKEAEVSDATRYTLRHHALSVLVEHFPIAVVARIAGHRDVKMVIEHYLHASSDEVDGVAEYFDSAAP